MHHEIRLAHPRVHRTGLALNVTRAIPISVLSLLTLLALSASSLLTTTAYAQTGGVEPSGPVRYNQDVYPDIPPANRCRCVDVMAGDCNADVGDEPNNACGYFWDSPYIWVRNQDDGFTNHTNQYPIAGQTNYVYVALHNRGTQSLGNGDLYLYFAKASTGLDWPASWIGNIQPNCHGGVNPPVVYGDLIGSLAIVNMGANTDAIARFTWTTVPDPDDFCDLDARHCCLLARFISPEDPMTYIENWDVNYNTKFNNNIAWKNETVLDALHPHAPVDVHNGTKVERRVRLKFEIPADELEAGNNILDHATVRINIGARFMEQWRATDAADGDLKDVGNTTVEVEANGASIDGLRLVADATEKISVEVTFPEKIPDEDAGREFRFNIVQLDDNASGEVGEAVGHVVGGETYIVAYPNSEKGRNIPVGGGSASTPDNPSLSEVLQLTVRPNPSHGISTISYTLPTAMPVTLSVYDVNGKLVRTLMAGAEQKAGAHTIEWDGTTADNAAVASGTYFFRIETPRGTARQQLGITR